MNRRSTGSARKAGAARMRQSRDEAEPAPAAEPLDPEFVARIRESLADPRPNIPAAQVRAELKAMHVARLKRGA